LHANFNQAKAEKHNLMGELSTFFELSFHGRTLSLKYPQVMGILNVTPDSFHAGSRLSSRQQLIDRAGIMLEEGAHILDIGGQSTRPGATRISANEELDRVLPGLNAIREQFPHSVLSIDTFYALVAKESCRHGADIINDISGGSIDTNMFKVAGELGVPYILTHIQGEPQTMQLQPHYVDVTGEIINYFNAKIQDLKKHGVHQIILDPGFGFGKRAEHNLQILRNLHVFGTLGYPILAGLSRKKTLQNIIQSDADHALNITTSANTIALMNGATILRVHDVREAAEAAALYKALIEA
jgi:dihydropteroate synthase